MMETWEVVVWLDMFVGLVLVVLCVVEAVRKDEFECELNDAAIGMLMVPFWMLFLAALGVEKVWARYGRDRWRRFVRRRRRRVDYA